MNRKMKNAFGALFTGAMGLMMAAGLVSCGNASGSVDPLSLFSDSSIPNLDPIISSAGVFTNGQAFTSSTPYWVLSNPIGFGGSSYIAPARGIVTSLGVGSFNGITGYYVTIAHSGRLATRYIGITPIVRQGDSVLAGQQIGTVVGYSGNYVAFQVILDGNPVCPLSYLSTNFRSQIIQNAWFGGGYLCQ